MKYMGAIHKGRGQTQSVSIAYMLERCGGEPKAQAAFQNLYLSTTQSAPVPAE